MSTEPRARERAAQPASTSPSPSTSPSTSPSASSWPSTSNQPRSAASSGPPEPGLVLARVVAQERARWRVACALDPGGPVELEASLRGRLRFEAAPEGTDLPVVGDRVWVEPLPGGEAVIAALAPRRGLLVRRAAGVHLQPQALAANVDWVFVVTAVGRDLNPRRLERLVALAWEAGAAPLVVLNKADLSDDPAGLLAELEAALPGAPALAVSALDGAGLDALRSRLREGPDGAPATAVLLGSSGVGKSTLTNALVGGAAGGGGEVPPAGAQATGAPRARDGRGRHTTTGRQLLAVPGGGCVIDTPGLREVGLWTGADVSAAFPEVEALAEACRFGDCTHDHEPGCAVLEAVDEGALAPDRLESWRQLQRELAHVRRKADPAAARAARRQWRAIGKSARAHMRRKYGD